MLDPWGDQTTTTDSEEQQADWADFSSQDNAKIRTSQRIFLDDFAKKTFEALPDSSEYLSALESKLSRIQGKKAPTSSASESRNLINGLTALRADRMKAFMDATAPPPVAADADCLADSATSTLQFSSNFTESDALYSSWLLQRMFPDRQALSEEELAALLRHDVLAGLNDQQQAPGCEDAASQSTVPNSKQFDQPAVEIRDDDGV